MYILKDICRKVFFCFCGGFCIFNSFSFVFVCGCHANHVAGHKNSSLSNKHFSFY